MSLIMCVDPGPEQSAFVTVRPDPDAPGGLVITAFSIAPNAVIRQDIWKFAISQDSHRIVFEQVACMGLAVGAEVLETCVWTGRFMEVFESAWHVTAHRIPRVPIKVHLCGSARAKDANVRQALIDRFGGQKALQKAKAPKVNRKGEVVSHKVLAGPLAGISSHCWSALALACVYVDRMKMGEFHE